MPTYEYVCTKCDQHLEVYQSFSEEPLKRHSGCGGKLTKVMGSVGIVLKGSGFYRNDSRSKRSDSGSGTKSSEKATSDSGSSTSGSGSSNGSGDSKPAKTGSDAKPAKKPDQKSA